MEPEKTRDNSSSGKSSSRESPGKDVVLIVDDNVQNVELLREYLETIDVDTIAAYDGIEALEVVSRSKPDLILLDIMMPKMSGFEVCRKLKSDPATRDIPIIMVTALSDLSDIDRGVESGTDDFLSKPINRLELITRVKSLLRLRHLKDELERTLAYLNEVESSLPENLQAGARQKKSSHGSE